MLKVLFKSTLVINNRKIQFVVSIYLLAVLALSQVKGKQILCENKTRDIWLHVGERKTCSMLTSTEIDSTDTTIEEDETIEALDFEDNKNINFLPIDVAISFPKLKIYSAYSCSIEKIAKINFKDLKALQSLRLNENLITTIASDTFEDLTSLEVLALGEMTFNYDFYCHYVFS